MESRMIAITINTQAIRVEKWLLNFWNIGFSKSRHPLLASLTGVLSALVRTLGSQTGLEPCASRVISLRVNRAA